MNLHSSSFHEFIKVFEFLGPFSKVTSPNTGIYVTTMGGVVLQVLSGDITKETTDVMVNSTNENFTLKSGNSDARTPDVAKCRLVNERQCN